MWVGWNSRGRIFHGISKTVKELMARIMGINKKCEHMYTSKEEQGSGITTRMIFIDAEERF